MQTPIRPRISNETTKRILSKKFPKTKGKIVSDTKLSSMIFETDNKKTNNTENLSDNIYIEIPEEDTYQQQPSGFISNFFSMNTLLTFLVILVLLIIIFFILKVIKLEKLLSKYISPSLVNLKHYTHNRQKVLNNEQILKSNQKLQPQPQPKYNNNNSIGKKYCYIKTQEHIKYLPEKLEIETKLNDDDKKDEDLGLKKSNPNYIMKN
jgi:hypothetical protein